MKPIIENIVDRLDLSILSEDLYKQLEILYLTNSNKLWEFKPLEKYSALILKDISRKYIHSLILSIIENLNKNEYALRFIQQKDSSLALENVVKKFLNLDNKVLYELISYCIILDRLTKILTEDITLLVDLEKFFKLKRQEINIYSEIGILPRIKYISVSQALKSTIMKAKISLIESQFVKLLLWFNIIEIALFELFTGQIDNAIEGFNLAFKIPKNITLDKNHNLNFDFENTIDWVNRYQMWNMCFTIELEDFPFSIFKLLIPSVSNYFKTPNNYMDNRLIALFLYVNYSEFKFKNKSRFGYTIDLKQKDSLKKLLGKFNRYKNH